MANNRSRYKALERLLTGALSADGCLLLLYLMFAFAGIFWLKLLLAVFSLLLSLAGLALLYLSGELLKRRSLWLSTGFFSVFSVILASLILAFP